MGNYVTKPLLERFLRHVAIPINKDECWLWTGALQRGGKYNGGYGKMGSGGGGGKTVLAHRVSYELFVGPIPDGLQLDHTCHKAAHCDLGPACPHRRCVNPSHLEPVTGLVNARRANYSKNGQATARRQLAKTHCPSGHAYSQQNTHIDSYGYRHCRECFKLRARATRARKLA